MQATRRLDDDIDIEEDEEYYDNDGRPRNFVGPYDEVDNEEREMKLQLAAMRRSARSARFNNLAGAQLMASQLEAARAAMDNKTVTSTTTVTSAEAMSSTNELCLYLMDTCVPHCTKACTSCHPRWSNLPSPEAEKAHIAQMENQHGIVKRIHPKDDNKTVRIDVQNKHMKGILASVLDGYPGFHASLLPEDSAWVFNEPFDMFVSRWDQLREYKLRTAFSTEKAAWVALLAAMTPVVQPTLDAIKRIRDTGLVIWKDLSLVFPPGKLIIVEDPGAVQHVARVQDGNTAIDHITHQQVHRLKFEYVDWDGKTHGFSTRTLDIPEYAGHKKVRVSDLKTMPIEFCPSEEELRTKLIARGRRWSALTGVEYKQFAGKKIPMSTRVSIEVSPSIDKREQALLTD